MTVEPRAALERLITALERHYEAAGSTKNPDHPLVAAAAQDLAEAFDDYDEALFDATEVATPLAVYGDDFDGHEDEDEPDGVYAGLDSDEYDDEEDDEDDDEDEDDEEDEDDDEDDLGDEDDDDLDDDDLDDEDDLDDDLDDEDDDLVDEDEDEAGRGGDVGPRA